MQSKAAFTLMVHIKWSISFHSVLPVLWVIEFNVLAGIQGGTISLSLINLEF